MPRVPRCRRLDCGHRQSVARRQRRRLQGPQLRAPAGRARPDPGIVHGVLAHRGPSHSAAATEEPRRCPPASCTEFLHIEDPPTPRPRPKSRGGAPQTTQQQWRNTLPPKDPEKAANYKSLHDELGTTKESSCQCWKFAVGFLAALVVLLLCFVVATPVVSWLFYSCGSECNLEALTSKLCIGKQHCGIVGSELRLGGVKLTADNARKLAIAIEGNNTLTALRLWETDLGNIGVGFICDAVALHEGIRTIQLAGNGLDDGGCFKVAEMLKKNEYLRYLDLNDNKVGNDGAELLAKGLAMNKALLTLNLWHNQIGERGAIAFANAFQTNDMLQELILSDNNIDDGGTGAIELRKAELNNNGLDVSWETDD